MNPDHGKEIMASRRGTRFPAGVPRWHISAGAAVEITTTTGGFRLINDNKLLALLADKLAVLIRIGPHSEELVFANPEDRKKLLVNY